MKGFSRRLRNYVKNATYVQTVLLSAASLQVSITPAQGEVSVGESKFFLCEGIFALFSFSFLFSLKVLIGQDTIF